MPSLLSRFVGGSILQLGIPLGRVCVCNLGNFENTNYDTGFWMSLRWIAVRSNIVEAFSKVVAMEEILHPTRSRERRTDSDGCYLAIACLCCFAGHHVTKGTWHLHCRPKKAASMGCWLWNSEGLNLTSASSQSSITKDMLVRFVLGCLPFLRHCRNLTYVDV